MHGADVVAVQTYRSFLVAARMKSISARSQGLPSGRTISWYQSSGSWFFPACTMPASVEDVDDPWSSQE